MESQEPEGEGVEGVEVEGAGVLVGLLPKGLENCSRIGVGGAAEGGRMRWGAGTGRAGWGRGRRVSEWARAVYWWLVTWMRRAGGSRC